VINVTLHLEPALLSLLERAVGLLSEISQEETLIMSTIQELIDDVAAEKTAIDSLVTFVHGLEDQIKAIGLPPATQAQIDQVFAAVEKNKAEIVAAMAVPPASPPPPTPPAA
jgi:uncharacterized protein YoxC